MNEILSRFEEMSTSDLTMIFEYLVELINYRKGQERLKKKRLKTKGSSTTDSQVKCSSAHGVVI